MHLYTYVYSYETSMCVCIVLHIYNCIYTAIYIITHFLLTICFVNIFSWLLYVFLWLMNSVSYYVIHCLIHADCRKFKKSEALIIPPVKIKS